ncbi:MAG: hypothetical protein ABJA78_12465 [Ferruginibacter sp.]
MKFIPVLFLALIFLFSCHSNDENNETADPAVVTPVAVKLDSFTMKLRDTITKIESDELKLGGYKLLGIQIDNISYEPASIKDFYQTRKTNMEKDRENQQKIYLKLKQDGIKQYEGKLQDDSIKNVKAMQTLTGLYEHADSAKSLYLVSYRMIARTNMASYNNSYKKYLNKNNLKEVRIIF